MNFMMPRRAFLRSAILGAAGLATMPRVIAQARHPSLWIADSDPRVALAVQLLARHLGLADAPIFACKRRAINCLQTEVTKPALLVTDYYSGQMRGDELIRLANSVQAATLENS